MPKPLEDMDIEIGDEVVVNDSLRGRSKVTIRIDRINESRRSNAWDYVGTKLDYGTQGWGIDQREIVSCPGCGSHLVRSSEDGKKYCLIC